MATREANQELCPDETAIDRVVLRADGRELLRAVGDRRVWEADQRSQLGPPGQHHRLDRVGVDLERYRYSSGTRARIGQTRARA